ncbi:MAG TPA: hypothetical protein VF644_05220, partial [Pyrinomonadaceae bacterium]
IQPWDRKPPVVASLPSEQLDGIFVWKDQAYLIESKAKKNKITPGSHDWEDFELKIRRRKNAVIGLFCSLFPVSEGIYSRAEELNKEGHFVIVLAGEFWDDINSHQLPMRDLLEYMNLFGRVKFLSKPPEVKKILEWCYDQETTSKKISDFCRKNSAIFLRRHKSPFHKDLYITRDVDNQIESYTKNLKPSVLLKLQDTAEQKSKEKPKQLCLIRDYSGSGKTTLSIEAAAHIEHYFGTGIAANEQDIDVKLNQFFNSLGDNFGLLELTSSNKPIVFVIDSLDEANFDLFRKRKEILSILKFIEEELNKIADRFGLLAFPVLFVFTIREDYWRDWEYLFEGREAYTIRKRISYFTDTELPKALKKYSNCYGYSITNNILEETKSVLSSPINLLIFSETYQYQGDITIHEIWEGNVIDTYFTRKKDDIHKRYIQGFTSNIFFQLIALLAFHVVETKKNSLSRGDIDAIIRRGFWGLQSYSDEIANALVSELILVIDSETLNHFRFRHSRFIEFLLAYYIVYTIQKDRNFNKLDEFAQVSFESGMVLMFRVHDDIRYIGQTKFPQVLEKIEEYYSTSNFFMSRKLLGLRSQLATNEKTKDEDIQLILKNINSNSLEVISNAYFVISAKSNDQPQQIVLNLFLEAYKRSSKSNDSYKLIAKLENHNLLLNEKVIDCILHSSLAKDWEVYLGLIHSNNLQSDFLELWNCLDGKLQLDKIIENEPDEDWTQVTKLMSAIYRNEKFILGT